MSVFELTLVVFLNKSKLFLLTTIIFGSVYSSFGQRKQHDPLVIFEELWQEFDLRYANFELKQVDWDMAYAEYITEVSASTSEKDLFNISCRMLQELNDGHVTMEAELENTPLDCGPPYSFKIADEFGSREAIRLYNTNLHKTLLKYGFEPMKYFELGEETNFQFTISEKYGYLRMDEMTETASLLKTRKALGRAFEYFESKQGLIIDLRLNGGGWDDVSYELAGRLSPTRRIGHFKQERVKGTESYTPLKHQNVVPSGSYQFTDPIIILTSDFTASAAEVFLLSVKDLPNATIVGDTTEGIFSDMYEFELSNGWELSLSHQRFFSSDTTNYEGVGITPDVYMVTKKDTTEIGLDNVLNKGIKELIQLTQYGN
ncbi:MAG: S41 family peptidase [Bacteroidota bacterium]